MFVIILLPLVPILLVFIKGKYDLPPMHYLVTLCLLDIINGLCDQSAVPAGQNREPSHNLLALLQLVATVQLFKTTLTRSARITLNILLVAFLSSVLTWYSVLGWGQRNRIVESMINVISLTATFLGLVPLIKNQLLQIFSSPLFFIGAGIVFHTLISLLVEWVGSCCSSGLAAPQPEGTIMLSISAVVKYILYTQAVLVCKPGKTTSDD